MKKEINVLDTKKLKKLGYNDRKYYCGPWNLMNQLTKLRNYLKDYGLPFPYNRACFVHDYSYNQGGSVLDKLITDIEFYRNMMVLLNNSIKRNKKYKKIYKRLKIRAIVFLIIVLLATPYYLKKGAFNWNGKWL